MVRFRITKTRLYSLILVQFVIILILAFVVGKGNSPTGFVTVEDTKYELLNPQAAQVNMDEFLNQQDSYTLAYRPLRQQVSRILLSQPGTYSMYYEDLATGSWIGVNEGEEYVPASLLKVSTMIAALKQIEQGKLSLDKDVKVNEDDFNIRSGNLVGKGDAYVISVEELLELIALESDNTASRTLRRLLSRKSLEEARLATDIPLPNPEQPTIISPKKYSTVFRTLYYSNYLRRPFSQFALSLLTKTEFEEGIPAGVPKHVIVAHKIGVNENDQSHHDCGIVYASSPYLICIMSKDTSNDQANKVIAEVSQTVYEYVEKN